MTAPAVNPRPLSPPVPALKRAIAGLQLPGLEPAPVSGARPRFIDADPAKLLVDETYQRGLSERSVALIRKIVAGWDWSRFKPPVVAETSEGLEVIDGQHTAIAAVCHGGLGQIPVMVVEADEQAGRAKAFIGHNRDRINITQTQLHAAAVAAGDEDAMTVDQVCQRAGVRVLRNPPSGGVFQPGDTLAVSSITALVNRRGAMKARIVLQVLTEARCAPVSAGQIKAIEMLLHDGEYAGAVDAGDLTTALIALGDDAEREARIFAAAHKVPVWRALGIVLFKRATRGRRRKG